MTEPPLIHPGRSTGTWYEYESSAARENLAVAALNPLPGEQGAAHLIFQSAEPSGGLSSRSLAEARAMTGVVQVLMTSSHEFSSMKLHICGILTMAAKQCTALNTTKVSTTTVSGGFAIQHAAFDGRRWRVGGQGLCCPTCFCMARPVPATGAGIETAPTGCCSSFSSFWFHHGPRAAAMNEVIGVRFGQWFHHQQGGIPMRQAPTSLGLLSPWNSD